MSVVLLILSISTSDLERFPDVGTCREQIKRCRTHEEWLRTQQNLHGWMDGRFESWREDVRKRERYWKTLELAHDPDNHGMVWQLTWLLRLRALIGEDHYEAGYHPSLLPQAARPRSSPMPRTKAPNA